MNNEFGKKVNSILHQYVHIRTVRDGTVQLTGIESARNAIITEAKAWVEAEKREAAQSMANYVEARLDDGGEDNFTARQHMKDYIAALSQPEAKTTACSACEGKGQEIPFGKEEKPWKWRTCGVCGGTGRIVEAKTTKKVCSTCGGRGHRYCLNKPEHECTMPDTCPTCHGQGVIKEEA